MQTVAQQSGENVIPLTVEPRPARLALDQHSPRFKIVPFINKRTEGQSWRVTGIKRDGERVRKNFSELKAAECYQVELTTEYLAREADTQIRATKLTPEQLRIAETAFIRLNADMEMLPAIEFWLKHGRQQAATKETPRLDEAVKQFKLWLDETDSLRDRSKDFLRTQIGIFQNSIPNLRVADITPEVIDGFLETREGSAQTKINSRLVVSRFFSWCMKGKDRRWVNTNPCTAVAVDKCKRETLPDVLTVEQCEKLLRAAQKYHRGRLVPYVSVCLFGGLRPAEAQRLTWDRVNLKDGEILIQSQASKTNKPRVVMIDDTLRAWLTRYQGKSFNPINRRRDLDAVKKAAGFIGRSTEGEESTWPSDVLRHTAISHYFRKSGSYGRAAEQFGNSEAIIKKHYQGRVSSEDTKAFYAIRPTRKATR